MDFGINKEDLIMIILDWFEHIIPIGYPVKMEIYSLIISISIVTLIYRIIPLSNWLVTPVRRSPKWCCVADL